LREREKGHLWNNSMFIEFIERVLTILKIKDLDLSSKIIDEWPYEIGIAIYKDVKPLLKDIKYRVSRSL